MPYVTITAFLSGAYQTNAFLISGSYTISGGEGILQVEGSDDVLIDYFKNTDTYLGLWYGGTVATSGMTLSSLTTELSASDYSRIKIPKNDWVVKSAERTIFTNREYSFRSLIQNYNVSGYFLSSSSDNSGELLEFIKFDNDKILNIEEYIHIRPSFQIFGLPVITSGTESVIVNFYADGDYFAGDPSVILAEGQVTCII